MLNAAPCCSSSSISPGTTSPPEEWIASLAALKTLDFDTVRPGPGEAYTDKAKIDYYQSYLRDAWSQTSRLKQQGVSAEDAVKRIDLSPHKDHYPPMTNLSV